MDIKKQKELLFPKSIWLQNGKISIPADRYRYTQNELNFFESLVMKKTEELQEEFQNAQGNLRDVAESFEGKADSIDNHQGDLLSKQVELARISKRLGEFTNVLFLIKQGTYGICTKTGGLIHPYRLCVEPSAIESIIPAA